MYKLKKIIGSNIFSAQFIKTISHYKKIDYNINVLQQTACLVVNPIMVGNFAFLFNCTCKELLEQNGFSVSQSLFLCLRNAFDITIRQTINPVPSQRRYYRLQQLELCFVLQMECCITHHNIAQNIETTLQCTEINIQSAQMQSRTSTRGSFWLHQSF